MRTQSAVSGSSDAVGSSSNNTSGALINALASEKDAGTEKDRRIAALAGVPAELAREQAAHASTRERLAYRESARGWFRLPFSLLKRRWSDPR